MHLLLITLGMVAITACGTANATSIDLDSTQQRALKDAEFYLKDVEKELPKLIEIVEASESGKRTLTANEVQKAKNSVTFLAQKMGNAKSRLEPLPAADHSVAAVTQRAETAMSSIMKVATHLENTGAGRGAGAAGGGNDLLTDAKTYQALVSRISYSDVLRNDAERALEVFSDLERMEDYRDSMVKKYGDRFGDSSVSAIEGATRHFDQCLPRFQGDAKSAVPAIITQARADIAQSSSIVEAAVERRRVASFQDGSVDKPLARAEDQLALVTAIEGNTQEVKSLKKEVSTQRKNADKAAKQLVTEIIESNTGPRDLYNGSDKSNLLTMVENAWKKAHKGSKVVGMRIPMSKWERWSGVRWAHDHYQLIDESSLQVAVVVEAKKGQAHIYYAHLKMDHQAGDDISLKLDDRGDVPPHRTMLVKNFK